MTNYSYKDFLDRGNLKIPSRVLLRLWSILSITEEYKRCAYHIHRMALLASHQRNVFIYLSFMEISWIVKHCYGVTLTTFNQMRSNAKHFIEKYPNHSKPTVIKISLNNMRAGGDDQITSLQFLVIQLEQNQPIDHCGAQKKFLQYFLLREVSWPPPRLVTL